MVAVRFDEREAMGYSFISLIFICYIIKYIINCEATIAIIVYSFSSVLSLVMFLSHPRLK